jgi:hypothetical protein
MTTFRDCDAHELIGQIGTRNILAISGGRVGVRSTGVTLPVSNGYSVTVDLDWSDTYVVRRVFKRGAKIWIKGEQRDVYCDQVGEVAYVASCFRNGSWPEPAGTFAQDVDLDDLIAEQRAKGVIA